MKLELDHLSLGLKAVVSPNSRLVASVQGSKVAVRSVADGVAVGAYSCLDKIDKLQFSSDSEFILCSIVSRNVAQVFSVLDPSWKCRIDEGVAGIVQCGWAPDSRHIITISDFGIQLCVWSLVDSSCSIIAHPKTVHADKDKEQHIYSFSPCNSYMAVIHRIDLYDYIAVYTLNPWKELTKFRSRSADAVAISWAPNSSALVLTDSPLSYKISVYSISGEVRTIHCIDDLVW